MVRPPSDSPTWAQTVLTEFVSAKVRSMSPKSSPPALFNGTPEISLPFAPLTTDSRVEAAGVERGGGGHDLHRRPRRVAVLRRAVDERRALLVLVERGERAAVGERVRVVARARGHREHVARLDPDRHERAVVAGRLERLHGRVLRPDVERRVDVVALVRAPEDRLERGHQLAAAADQLVVVRALGPGAADRRVRVADRVGEQLAVGVAARVRVAGPADASAPAPSRRGRG